MTDKNDWNELRHEMLLSTGRINFSNVDYWDKQAKEFQENILQMGDLTQKQLNRLPFSPDYTVLDVGAGTGRITIPLARHALYVTALEPSANMIALLKENAQKEKVKNIEYRNTSIEDLDTRTIMPHDIVIASFSLLMVNLKKALLNIDAIATRGVYLFLSASKWMDEEIQNIVYGNDYSSSNLPDYIYVCNILDEIGILVNVDIWNFESKQKYNNLDEATSRFMQQYSIPAKKQDELKVYLSKNLVRDNKGKMWLYRKKKAATIWWTKTK